MAALWRFLPSGIQNLIIATFPRILARIFYLIPFFILRLRLPKNLRAEIWPRHSFVLGTFIPFVSDLDITFWMPEEPPAEIAAQIRDAVSVANRFLPVIREINIYKRKDAPFLTSFMNPFEMDRDPILKSKLELDGKFSKTDFLGAVFLWRMLESDLRNLLERPARRERKWKAHLRAVQREAVLNRGFSWKNTRGWEIIDLLLETITDLCDIDKPERRRCVDELKSFLQQKAGIADPLWIDPRKYQWIFSPHVMVHKSGFFEPRQIKGPALKIFLAQIQWEIWGLGTQYVLCGEKRSEFLRHLEKLTELVQEVARENSENLQCAAVKEALYGLRSRIEILTTGSLSGEKQSRAGMSAS